MARRSILKRCGRSGPVRRINYACSIPHAPLPERPSRRCEPLPEAPSGNTTALRGRRPKEANSLRTQRARAAKAQVHALQGQGFALRAIARQTGFSRNAVRRWLREQQQNPRSSDDDALLNPLTAKPLAATSLQLPPPPPPWSDWNQLKQVREELRCLRGCLPDASRPTIRPGSSPC